MYKYNFSVSGNLLSGHVNRHSKQLIHKISIVNIFNDFKKFLTIFSISFDYNLNFSHTFNFNATCDDNLVIHECILTRYTELINCVGPTEKWFL